MNRYLTFFLVTLLITFSTILLKAQTSPVFTSTPPTSGSYGSVFEYLISTDDTENDAREIILKSGILPMGLSLTDHLDGTAQLSGITLETGIFNLVISVQEVADPTQFSDQEISIEILKSLLTVSANPTNRTYGEVNPFFSYTITGFKNGENEGDLLDLPQISTLADQFSNAGSYDLIPFGALAVNYSFEYISGILIIEKASAEILVTDEIQNYDGFPKTITVTTNPSGLNFNVVYLNIPTTPTEPGSYEYQVDLDEVNYFGTSTGFFTINANPVSSGSIQVFMLEDAEPSSINLLNYFTDDQNIELLTFQIENISNPSIFKSTIINNNLLEIVLKPDKFGTSILSIKGIDTYGLFSILEIQIIVTDVNDAPSILSVPLTQINEGENYHYTINFSDIENESMTISSQTQLPEFISLTQLSNESALLSGIPYNKDVGTYIIQLKVIDNRGLSTIQEFILNVINVNDSPQFTSTPITKTIKGGEYNYIIEVNDIDANDQLEISTLSKPDWLNFNVLSSNSAKLFGLVPVNATNQVIKLKVTDLKGSYAIQSFELVINNKPIITSEDLIGEEDITIEIDKEYFQRNYTDIDLDPISTLTIVTIPKNGDLYLGSNKLTENYVINYAEAFTVNYLPGKDYYGFDSFSWLATDSWEDSNVSEVNITILPVNDAPVISNLEPFQLNFSQGDAPVKISNTLTVNDIDNSSMLYAEIKILDFTEGAEGLIYDDKGIGEITSLYDPKTGILVLEGEESKSAYEEALKNVSYKNDIIGFSDQVNRVIELKINDGLSFSEPVYRKINITNILPDISVVNAFTPNDDGINDYWDFENLDYYKFINIKVYSIDKQLLFQCDNRECKWDGKLNGKTLESGPYFYLIDLEKGKRIYKGTVYILN